MTINRAMFTKYTWRMHVCSFMIVVGMYLCFVISETFCSKCSKSISLNPDSFIPSLSTIGIDGTWVFGNGLSTNPGRSDVLDLAGFMNCETKKTEPSGGGNDSEKDSMLRLPGDCDILAFKRASDGSVIAEIATMRCSSSTLLEKLAKAGWAIEGSLFDQGIRCTLQGRSLNLWSPNPEAEQPTLFITR